MLGMVLVAISTQFIYLVYAMGKECEHVTIIQKVPYMDHKRKTQKIKQ